MAGLGLPTRHPIVRCVHDIIAVVPVVPLVWEQRWVG